MRYNIERACIEMSVRELCEMAYSGGDLDLRPGTGGGRPSFLRAVLGAKVHRKLQAAAGAGYQAEVTMTHTEQFHGLTFEVEGRADGVIAGEPYTVDEIKTVSGFAFSQPPAPIHFAQVKCYAHFLCRAKGLERIQTRLTYYRIDDGEIRYIEEEQTARELATFYADLLARVEYRARILEERQTVLLPAIAGGRFPFSSVREGQDDLIRACYRAINTSKRLFVDAPTGIGKTVSTLYPALRALGEGKCEKVFYLTAKAATRREAYGASAQLFEAGSRHRTVVLTAREQVCPNDEAKKDTAGISRHCNPQDCPRADGFYDRAPLAICELLKRQSGYSRAVIEEIAAKYRICPYELQLELSEFCDVIICDYNYVFDPQVHLHRYFGEDAPAGKYAVLVDEAHNLPDRARNMFSAELKCSDLYPALEVLPPDSSLRDHLQNLLHLMQSYRKLCRDTLQTDGEGVERGYDLNHGAMESFHTSVRKLRPVLDAWMRSHRGEIGESEIWTLSGALRRVETIAEIYDKTHVTFVEVEGEELTVRLICLDPSQALDERLRRLHGCVFFSATMVPMSYYADVLGGGNGGSSKHSTILHLKSPFDPENFMLCTVNSISTRLEDRPRSYKKLVDVIAATASAKAGNYIVYFPSYDYMNRVQELFSKKYPQVTTVVQKRGMSVTEREQFLDAFKEDTRLRIGFCVLGGSFSEGVDLPGKHLIGAIVVGTGLPGISNEGNILSEYYEHTRGSGFDYAYRYPGYSRVLQAAGRVIRRDDDHGVVVLVDDSWGSEKGNNEWDAHWSKPATVARTAPELAEILQIFWKKFK